MEGVNMTPRFISFALFVAALYVGGNCYHNVAIKYTCPTEDLASCTCLEAYGNVFLQCSGLQNRQQLVEAFRKMAGHGITELLIKNSNVSHIPRDLFKASPVSRIRVKNTLMFYLFDRELESGANLVTDITLDHVDFEGGLDWNVLDNLESLQTLSVSGSNVESIPYGASELELPLELLVLEGNYLQYVHELAFQNMKRLKNLKLNKNFLVKYSRSMLPLPQSELQFLDLSFNKLTHLPMDAFDGMPKLHSLLLRGNSFAVLEKSYMKSVFSSLFFLDVAKNPLTCSCELTWILSAEKPYHLFGECKALGGGSGRKRNLQELTDDDFVSCFA